VEFNILNFEMLKKYQKKAQFSLIAGLIFGIASLIIGVIISFLIVQTLTGADLLSTGRTTKTVINETVTPVTSGVNLAKASDLTTFSCGTITAVYNITDSIVITSGNYTQTGCLLINTTSEFPNSWKVNYPYTLKTSEEFSAEKLSANFSSGIDNVSGKLPTVLLVAAIVLILGVLVLLVGAWQRMRIGGGGI